MRIIIELTVAELFTLETQEVKVPSRAIDIARALKVPVETSEVKVTLVLSPTYGGFTGYSSPLGQFGGMMHDVGFIEHSGDKLSQEVIDYLSKPLKFASPS